MISNTVATVTGGTYVKFKFSEYLKRISLPRKIHQITDKKINNLINLLYFVIGFPGLCSCCPIKPPNTTTSSSSSSSDPRSSSVAELRRKAQEHSAALLQSLHAAAAAGLAFPGLHLPPLSLHSALNHRKMDLLHEAANNVNNDNETQHNGVSDKTSD